MLDTVSPPQSRKLTDSAHTIEGRHLGARHVVPTHEWDLDDALLDKLAIPSQRTFVAQEDFDVESPPAAKGFRKKARRASVRPKELRAALRIVNRQPQTERRTGRVDSSAVMPQQRPLNIATQKLNARPEHDLSVAGRVVGRSRCVQQAGKLIERRREVCIEVPTPVVTALEGKEHPLANGLVLAAVLGELMDHETFLIALGDRGEHRSVLCDLFHRSVEVLAPIYKRLLELVRTAPTSTPTRPR